MDDEPVTPDATAPQPFEQASPDAAVSALAAQFEAELAATSAQVAEARAAYASASDEYQATKHEFDQANQLASDTDQRAEAAEQTATTSARLLLRAVRAGGNPLESADPLAAIFAGTGGNLLQRLGSLDQLARASASPSELAARAEHDAVVARGLRTQADKAKDAVGTIPVESNQQAVASASAAVDSAEARMASVQLQIASTGSVTRFPNFVDDGRLGKAAWVDPLRGQITDGYGPRPSRPLGTGPFHYGDDIAAACSTWIVAAAAGTVESTGPNGSYGNWVLIDHGHGVQTVYGHIENGGTLVHVGEAVVAGQPIALVGSTGLSTGCHLHFEVRIDGQRIDPQPFLAVRGVIVGR
ncbi:M23 family metallopeptidase [Diaminobutyricibacter sp. McL0608]|uniref:M23 family metallopeptidase n=1 Tax=Leifsonia sp. McL0608 TaxID=3143537 RepID=UPI0031F2F43E